MKKNLRLFGASAEPADRDDFGDDKFDDYDDQWEGTLTEPNGKKLQVSYSSIFAPTGLL